MVWIGIWGCIRLGIL